MQIQILDNQVTFDFYLKTDTPEVVAREFVSDVKLDPKYYNEIKDDI